VSPDATNVEGRIVAADLTKVFGQVKAVDGLSFSVEPGSVTGFLGPNGAGKTTTLRIILGLAAPTSGSGTISGVTYAHLPAPGRTVGAVLEATSFHPGRSARNHLRVFCAAAGLPDKRADEVLELVGLTQAARFPVRGFSLGMRQRLGLATALLGNPRVLLLDEPANGLDPEGIAWLRGLLRHFADVDGRTVLVSSHVLSEVEQTVDRVVIIARGRLIYEGRLADLGRSQCGSRGADADPGAAERRARATQCQGHCAPGRSGRSRWGHAGSRRPCRLGGPHRGARASLRELEPRRDIPASDRRCRRSTGGSRVIPLLRAEWRKVTTVKLGWGMLLGAMALAALGVVAQIASNGASGNIALPLSAAATQKSIAASASSAYLFSVVVGIILITTEFRHFTSRPTFLIEPRRGRVIVAKLIIAALVGIIYGAICAALTAAIMVIWLGALGVTIGWIDNGVLLSMVGDLVVIATFAIVGIGVGVLVRNQIAAVISALVYLFVLEPLIDIIPVIQKAYPYLPGRPPEPSRAPAGGICPTSTRCREAWSCWDGGCCSPWPVGCS
jgi:ABC-2 type transport system ATP-binding protein